MEWGLNNECHLHYVRDAGAGNVGLLTPGDALEPPIICIQYCDKEVRTEFTGRHRNSHRGKSQQKGL